MYGILRAVDLDRPARPSPDPDAVLLAGVLLVLLGYFSFGHGLTVAFSAWGSLSPEDAIDPIAGNLQEGHALGSERERVLGDILLDGDDVTAERHDARSEAT